VIGKSAVLADEWQSPLSLINIQRSQCNLVSLGPALQGCLARSRPVTLFKIGRFRPVTLFKIDLARPAHAGEEVRDSLPNGVLKDS